MTKRIIGSSLKFLVTAALFVLLFRPQTYGLRPDLFGGVTPATLWRELRAAEPRNIALWLTLAAAVRLSGMLAGIVRWRLLLYGQGLSMPFWYMTQSWFVGRFFGIFTPGTIGLDGYRLYDSSMYTREVIKCASVIVVEKLIGFISLTFLVFLTFPLGFRLLQFNVVILSLLLAALGMLVVISFLLLLNPRVIQVLVAAIPTPGAVRAKIDKLGAAITAYSGRRMLLMGAVLCGLWVHVATCLMYACTMMSLRAAGTNVLDILFASPIMIYGTVVGPSIGGEGIREIVFAVLLGPKTGVATAVLFGHLGWWIGDVLPFLIGAPIFFLRSRPARTELESEVAAARRKVADAESGAHLTPETVAQYRSKIKTYIGAGISAGLITGAFVGLAEAAWLRINLAGLTEFSAFWWGPLVYGILYVGLGFGMAAALLFVSLIFDKFLSAAGAFALSIGGATLASGIIVVFRFVRDLLHGHALTPRHLAGLAMAILGAAVLTAVAGWMPAVLIGRNRRIRGPAVLIAYTALVAAGILYAVAAPGPASPPFTPAAEAKGPDIILVAIDALRADYLKMYSPQAVANTPRLEAFSRDCIRFQNCFAQASWTKPSFATIFTATYPGCHTATGKVSMLPAGTATFPKMLQEAGYYTKGFANNPNIAAVFQFDQGFHDYVDLKPRLYFAAGYSASKLSLYAALRRVRHIVLSKISDKLNVRDFYQPAETVSAEALHWLDRADRPKNAPFFLFLHYMDPHDPFMDHARPGIGYARVRMEHPDPQKFLEPMKAAYLSEIEYMDRHLGALFDGLRDRGIYDNALIVLTSDHGEEFFDHRGWWHGQTLFDELIRVPLLVKLPQNKMTGQVNTDFARHIDIGPTILHIAQARPDDKMQGKPLLNPAGGFANADIESVFAESDFENNVIQAVRNNNFKVIKTNPDNPRKLEPLQVFDIQQDPGEQHNLNQTNDPRSTPLISALDSFIDMSRNCAKTPAPQAAISEELKQQLQGIGYLGK